MPKATKSTAQPPHAKVGIFMPYYNMAGFIDEGVESLYEQTLQDFNVIIADDASPKEDASKKLSTIKRPRCQIFYEKKNMGLIKIANKYMAKLDADYVMLYSPDDKMHPDLLKEEVAYLDAHPDVHAVCTWIQEFGDGERILKYYDNKCKLPEMLVENYFSGAALVRKSAWLAAGMHDTNKQFFPNLDYELWLSMLSKSFTLGTIPKPLFYWRVAHSSLSHAVDASQMLVFRKALLKKYLPLYEQYSGFVLNHYLEVIGKFENHYVESEEGHDWLDQQYKALTQANDELLKENERLRAELDGAIRRPYLRTAAYKVKRHLKRPR